MLSDELDSKPEVTQVLQYVEILLWLMFASADESGVWWFCAAAGWVCSERVHTAGPESGGAGQQTLLRPAAVARSQLLMQLAGPARWRSLDHTLPAVGQV